MRTVARAVALMETALGAWEIRELRIRIRIKCPLNRVFGVIPEIFHAFLPNFPDMRKPSTQFSDEALKMIYVDYDLPGPGRIHGTRSIQNKGNVWLAFAWTANRIAISILNRQYSGVERATRVTPQESVARSFSNRGSGWDGMVCRDTQCK